MKVLLYYTFQAGHNHVWYNETLS